MPLYEFSCSKCGKVTEQWFNFMMVPEQIRCPDCHEPAKRIISKTSFKLNGEGWAKDGYAKTAKPKP